MSDPGRGTLPATLPAPALVLAWAIKDEVQAAWGSQPARVLPCAALMEMLCAQRAQPELLAVADWVRGFAHLVQGQALLAAQELERARSGFAALGQQQHAALTQVSRLVALVMLGRSEEALACGQAALQQFLASGDTLSAGKIELNMGTLLSRQSRHAEAAALQRRAAVRFARAKEIELSVAADLAMAFELASLFEFDEALRISQRALMRATTHGMSLRSAQARGSIGAIERHLGHHHVALRELAAASRQLAELGATPQGCMAADSALAEAYLAVSLLPEAAALYQQVIARARELQEPVELAWALLHSASALDGMGRRAAALVDLTEARELHQSQGNTAAAAMADVMEAAAELHAGNAPAALRLAQAAALVLADAGVRTWQLQAQALAAEAALALGDNARARQGFEDTLARAHSLPALVLGCHLGLGELAWRERDASAARNHLQSAQQQVDQVRAALFSDELRAAQAQRVERAQDLLVEIALAEPPDDLALFDCIEQGRGQALDLSLRDGHKVDLSEHSDQLRSRWSWTQQRLRAALASADGDLAKTIASEVATLETQLLEARRRDTLTQPLIRPASQDAQDQALLSADLRLGTQLLQALPPGTALVSFHQLGTRLVACVAFDGRMHRVLSDASELPERLRALRFQLDSLRFGAPAMRAHAAQLQRRVMVHLQALHRQVWAPLQGWVAQAQHVVVVPHRSLHYLPFAALHNGGQWLIEQHRLSLVPSARLWLAVQGRGAQVPGSVLAVGHGGSTLPHVSREVQSVAAAFGPRGRVLEGAVATQQALREALGAGHVPVAPGAGSVDVLHLACHGQFRADSPSFSALELADGPLTLLDAQELPVAGSLVALSACDTGQSALAPGNELLGLVRGFLLAGAPSVLASLWTVDDGCTADLMADFYAGLRAGQQPAAALQAAQLRQVRLGLHPFFWAAFALHGRG
jgi:CHAT domain-containing protein